jgi:hypothetical protein
LEGEPLPQSDVLRALEQVLIKDLSVPCSDQGSLCTLLRSSFPRSWLVSQSLPLKNIPTRWYCHSYASP